MRLTWLLGLFSLITFLPTIGSGAESKSGVDPQVISLPSGPGSIEGLGESFEPDLNTGTAPYGVKITVSPGVSGFEPSVRLVYNSGYGNSPVGLGWDLNLEYIQRQTDKGLPNYAVNDVFLYSSGGELVPLPDDIYRLKIEGSFTKFKKNSEGWEAWRRDGTHLFFGSTVEGQQHNVNLGIFAWYLQKEIDTNGNEIRYFYTTNQGKVYLQEIRYSIMSASVYKSVRFFYETRPDAFTSYISRAKVTTDKRLKSIEIRSEEELIRTYQLAYHPKTIFSLLSSVTQYGSDSITALPPLSFTYSSYDVANQQTVVMTDIPPAGISPVNSNVDLIDINGDALPDLIHTDSALQRHAFYINDGKGAWQKDPVIPENSPPHLLATDGVMMADMNGDGLSDLFVKNSGMFGFFKNKKSLKWEESDWTACTPNPGFSFESQKVKLMDVNNDKLIDVMIDNGTSYLIWLNHQDNNWNQQFDFETYLPAGAHLDLNSPYVKMGDMNGDRMQDLVFVLNGYVSYFPSMGNGQYDTEVAIDNPPDGLGQLAEKLTIADIDNNGLDDLALVGNENVVVWFNTGNNSFSAPATFTGTPRFQAPAVYRFADMNGDGFTDLLITDETAPDRYVYVDFNKGIHPNLLTAIDNGLGMKTSISYKSSTEDYLADRTANNPWTDVLPFPVQVVAGIDVQDLNSGQHYITDYHYRDGYYDGNEKEFRGFTTVQKLEHGGTDAPSLLSVIQFDTGITEESRKGLITSSSTLTENGTLNPISGLFDRQNNTIRTNQLFTGLNGERVRFSYLNSSSTSIYEKTDQAAFLYHVFEQDNYGNTIKDFNYGRISGTDYSIGNDEILTTTNFTIDEVKWLVDRPSIISSTNLDNTFIKLQHNYYDDQGNMTSEEHSPDGTIFIPLIRNQYDSYGNIVTITDANNHCRDITYDNKFHTLPVTESICGLGLEMTAEYNHGLGKITYYIDYNDHATSFVYDALGRLTSIIKPGDSILFPTQSFAYTLASPVSHVTTKSREQSGTGDTYDTIAYVDGLGRKLQTRSEGEGDNWVVTDAVTFNQRKEIANKWLPYFSSTMEYQAPAGNLPKESMVYDAKKRIVKQINPDGTYRTSVFTPLARTEYDEEDNAGGLHANTAHTFNSDGLDRLTQVKEENSGSTYTTKYGYDGLNNLVRIEDNEGNIKTMEFDGLGRKVEMDDPDKHQMSYTYDAAGNLLSTTDAKGQKVEYTFDTANRMLTEKFGDVKVRYHYDADLAGSYPAMQNTLGRIAWVEDEAGKEFYSYDQHGNALMKVREVGGKSFTNRMTYDALNRLTTLTYPDTSTVTYQYNNRNLLEAIPGFVTGIDYNAAGRKTRFQYANGLTSSYQYDDRQRMTELQSARQATMLQQLTYGYDSLGNITAINDGRIQKIPESLNRTFKYDDLYRLTEASAPDWMETYQYSSIGNMTFKSDVGNMTYGGGEAGPHAVTKAATAGLNYSYDLNGNLSSKKPGFSYLFDYRDRLVQANRDADQAIISYSYDYKGDRKTKTVTKGPQAEKSIYIDQYSELRGNDLIKKIYADDRLVARIFTPATTTGLNMRSNPLSVADFDSNPADGVISLEEIRRQGANSTTIEQEETADALQIYYANREDNPALLPFTTIAAALHTIGTPSQMNMGSIYYYLPDHLGSPALVTDINGDVVEESVFYPYGSERKRFGTFTSDYRFTGKELDDETGLHYFGARYYDAQTGRFVSVDPLYVDVSAKNLHDPLLSKNEFVNLYSYSINNPIRFIDNNGLNIKDFLIAFGSEAAGSVADATGRGINFALTHGKPFDEFGAAIKGATQAKFAGRNLSTSLKSIGPSMIADKLAEVTLDSFEGQRDYIVAGAAISGVAIAGVAGIIGAPAVVAGATAIVVTNVLFRVGTAGGDPDESFNESGSKYYDKKNINYKDSKLKNNYLENKPFHNNQNQKLQCIPSR